MASTSAHNDIFIHIWSDYMRNQDLCKLSSIAKFKYSLNSIGTQLAYIALRSSPRRGLLAVFLAHVGEFGPRLGIVGFDGPISVLYRCL